jgi:hypothetical protein
MKGKNLLILCRPEMNVIIQEYLDSHYKINSDVIEVDLKNGSFEITLMEKEIQNKNAEAMK